MLSRLMMVPLVAGVFFTTACAKEVTRSADGPVPPPSNDDPPTEIRSSEAPAGPQVEGMEAVAPMLSVERFLQAVNARDFEGMAVLFGTHEGPIDMDPLDLELRMSILAEVLRHEDYRIVSERRAPGREHRTNRIGVNLTIGGRVVPDVAFHVVQTESGRWLVESVDTEKVAGR